MSLRRDGLLSEGFAATVKYEEKEGGVIRLKRRQKR